MSDNAEVSLTLVCLPCPPEVSDAGVAARLRVILGVGRVGGPRVFDSSVHGERQPNGTYLLHVFGKFRAIQTTLTSNFFDWKFAGEVRRVALGLVRTPDTLGWLEADGSVSSLTGEPGRVARFLSQDKARLLQCDAGAGPTVGTLRDAIATACEVSGIDLFVRHADLLGDVLVVSADGETLLPTWEPARGGDAGEPCTALDIEYRPAGAQEVVVKIVAFDPGDHALFAKVLTWKPGMAERERCALDNPRGSIGSVQFSAWKDGDLVVDHRRVLLLGFNGSLFFGGGTFNHQDKLARLSKGTLASTQLASRGVEMMTGVRLTVPTAGEVAAAVRSALPEQPPLDSWFSKGWDGRVAAFKAILKKVKGAEKVWVLDPFFDVTAAQTLLTRLGNRDTSIHVVTSLPPSKDDAPDLMAALKRFLSASQAAVLPLNITIDRVVRKNGEQAFHDRFLLIETVEGVKGWMLSNSFSGLAVNYPLVVLECPAGVANRAKSEILDVLASLENDVERVWPMPGIPQRSSGSGSGGRDSDFGLAVLRAGKRFSGSSDLERIESAVEAQFVLRGDGDRVRWNPAVDAIQLLDETLSAAGAKDERLPLLLGFGRARWNGLNLSAADVARHVSVADTDLLVSWLEESNPFPDDPNELWPGCTLAEVTARQCLAASVASDADVVDRAVSYWAHGYETIGIQRPWFLRVFVYQVLFAASPEKAISLAVRLHDADLVAAMVGRSFPARERSNAAQILAAQQSASLFLRALVPLQDRVQVSPEDALLRVADDGSIEPGMRMRIVVAAASQVQLAATPNVAARIVALFGEGAPSEEDAGVIAEYAWKPASRLAKPLVKQLVGNVDAPARLLLEAIVAAYRADLDVHENTYLTFGAWQLDYLETASLALAALWSHSSGADLADLQMPKEQLKRLREALRPLTPFRERPAASRARAALAWASLWEVVAALTLRAAGKEIATSETVKRVAEVLSWEATPSANELWDALSRCIQQLREGVEPGAADGSGQS